MQSTVYGCYEQTMNTNKKDDLADFFVLLLIDIAWRWAKKWEKERWIRGKHIVYFVISI